MVVALARRYLIVAPGSLISVVKFVTCTMEFLTGINEVLEALSLTDKHSIKDSKDLSAAVVSRVQAHPNVLSKVIPKLAEQVGIYCAYTSTCS
ncbi:hypothetical protein EON64_09100 [archaeon]|nr:MAG: hypothetical protein EON64_09100 [archaeon]